MADRNKKTPAERAMEKLGVRRRAAKKLRTKLREARDAVVALEQELAAEQKRLAYVAADPDLPEVVREELAGELAEADDLANGRVDSDRD